MNIEMGNHIVNFLLGLCAGLGISTFVIFYIYMCYLSRGTEIWFLNKQIEHWKFMAKVFGKWGLEIYERNKNG